MDRDRWRRRRECARRHASGRGGKGSAVGEPGCGQSEVLGQYLCRGVGVTGEDRLFQATVLADMVPAGGALCRPAASQFARGPHAVEGLQQGPVAASRQQGADLYCWLTQGEPADWPVVVFSHGDDTWTRFGYGMTEFLCRVIQADTGVQPMHDIPLWGRSVS